MAQLTHQSNQSSRDWQSMKETVRDRTAFMFNNPLMSDVKFVVSDSEAIEPDSTEIHIPVHKFVLAISSPVFYAMFYGEMAEKKKEIELPDTNSASLLELLRFIYCDEVNLTSGNILGVMYLAKKYMVASLAQSCSSFLANSMNAKNVCEILMEARKFEEEDLERQCWELIVSNTRDCLATSSFQNLDHETVKRLLKQDTLTIDECTLFQAVLRWVKPRCSEVTGPQMRSVLGDAIYDIRFPSMVQEEFAEHVVPLGILNDSEVVSIFMHFSCKDWKLCFTPESRLERKIYRCSRFDGTHSGSGENPRSEALSFQTDRAILLHGVRLYANYYAGCRCKIDILVQCNERIIASATGTFTTGREFNTCGFDLNFPNPAFVKSSVSTTLKLTLNALSVSAGSLCVYPNKTKTSHEITASGVKFTFESVTESNVLELIFSLS